MAKSKTFKYEGDGPVSIVLPATANMVALEPGDTVEAETDAEREAFAANPDLSEVRGGTPKAESSRSESASKSKD